MPNGGGSGGGVQQQWSSNSQTSNNMGFTDPSPTIAPRLAALGDDFWKWAGEHMYPSPSLASQQANSMLFNRGAAGSNSPIRQASQQAMLDTLQGKYLNPAENPAYQDFLSASFRPQAEQFRDIIAPSIDSKFIGSGRVAYSGTGAHSNATAEGYGTLAQAQADAGAKAGLGLYQGERGNMLSALGMSPSMLASFQAQDYADIDAVRRAGDTQDYWTYGSQPDYYARLGQILQTIYPGGQTTGSSSSTGSSMGTGYTPASGGGGGGASQFIGPAVSLAGTAMMVF